MTFSIDNSEGGLQQPPPPPLGKYVWEKPSGEQGLNIKSLKFWSASQTPFHYVHQAEPSLFPTTKHIISPATITTNDSSERKGPFFSGVPVLGLGRFLFLMVRWVQILFRFLQLCWFQKGAIEVDCKSWGKIFKHTYVSWLRQCPFPSPL